jgi:hypothetical protein
MPSYLDITLGPKEEKHSFKLAHDTNRRNLELTSEATTNGWLYLIFKHAPDDPKAMGSVNEMRDHNQTLDRRVKNARMGQAPVDKSRRAIFGKRVTKPVFCRYKKEYEYLLGLDPLIKPREEADLEEEVGDHVTYNASPETLAKLFEEKNDHFMLIWVSTSIKGQICFAIHPGHFSEDSKDPSKLGGHTSLGGQFKVGEYFYADRDSFFPMLLKQIDKNKLTPENNGYHLFDEHGTQLEFEASENSAAFIFGNLERHCQQEEAKEERRANSPSFYSSVTTEEDSDSTSESGYSSGYSSS